MRNAVIATTAMMASSALAAGSAQVINACKYDVYMANTPAMGGGFNVINQVLAPGDSYTQPWTELTNGMGWSIKLAKQPSYEENLLQYEYTYHNNDIIWYDLSQVNGNPWDSDWMITAAGDSNCNPKQQAYRYATDDAYGMQSCPSSADITVTLCSGENQADGVVSSIQASSPAETTQAAAPTYAQPSTPAASEAQPTTTQQPEAPLDHWTIGPNGLLGFGQRDVENAPLPTTLVTKALPTTSNINYGTTVTEVVTDVATAVVTAGVNAKRHEHHPRHPHMAHQE